MRPDNELLLAARLADINEHRVRLWRYRYALKTGEYPASADIIRWPWQRACGRSPERHGNASIVKFPRHRHQYMGAELPDGPEVA